MTSDVLLSGLLGAIFSTFFYIIFSHYSERQRLRIGLLEEFTKHYDIIFAIVMYMKVYKQKISEKCLMNERLSERYSEYNNQLRELQISSYIDNKLRALYIDPNIISLHNTFTNIIYEMIQLIRTTRFDNWDNMNELIYEKGNLAIPLYGDIVNQMIEKIRDGSFFEICLPTFYSFFKKWKIK